MISRNLSRIPTFPLVSSQQYCEPLIGQYSPNTGLWLVKTECHSSRQKVTTTHNPGGSHHSLKNVPRVQHFYDKEINISRDILLNILWWIILCLGGSWLTKYYNKIICKNIMSAENILCLRSWQLISSHSQAAPRILKGYLNYPK